MPRNDFINIDGAINWDNISSKPDFDAHLADSAKSIVALGAIGDGDSAKATANTTAIQNYINTTNNPVLLIPPGTFCINTLSLKNGTKIIGQGRNQSILKNVSTGAAIKIVGSNVEGVYTFLSDICLEDFQILGNNLSTNGLEIAYCTRSIFKNLLITGNGADGINIGYSWLLDFYGCKIISNLRDGVRLDKSLNASIETDDQNAIHFWGGYIESNSGIGVNSIGGRYSGLHGVCIEGNGSQGVLLSKTYSFTVEGCGFEQNGVNNKTATITITDITDGIHNVANIIKHCFIQGTNLSGVNATYGIDVIGGYGTQIEGCFFANNLLGSINNRANTHNTYIGPNYKSGSDPQLVTNNSADSVVFNINSSGNMELSGAILEMKKNLIFSGTSAIIENYVNAPLYLRSRASGNAFMFDTYNANSVLTSRVALDGNIDVATLRLTNRTRLQLYPDSNALPEAGNALRGAMALITGAGADQLYICRLNATHTAYEWVQITT